MHTARWLLALALTAGSLTAHAEELALPDGSRWTLDGTTLRRGGMSATLQVHTVGIDCATGLAGKARVNASYLPPRFLGVEDPDGGSTRASACFDGNGAAVVVTVRWPGALAGADRDSVRALLEYFGQAAAAAGPPPAARTLALFQPAIAQVPLTAATGGWDHVVEGTTATSAILVLTWPLTTALLKLDRSPATQGCSTVGFTGVRPAWAPAPFAPLGAVRDGMAIACFDGPDGHLLLVTGGDALPANAQVRVRAVLDAIATTLGSLPAPAAPSAVAPIAPPVPATPPDQAALPLDTPPPPRRSLASYLHGFSIAVHQLSPSTAGLEDGHGVALEYRRTIPRRGTLIPRVTVQGGYDNLSKWMADAQFALGARTGDWDYGLAFHAAVGFDGIGLGEDAATAGPVYIPGDVYYGGQLAFDASGITAAIGYYVRNADAIDSEWRLELGYALAPGRRLIGRYTTYATVGSQLSLGLAF